MLKVSRVTGKTYSPDDPKSLVYVANLRQIGAYLANGGADDVLDVMYDMTGETHRLVFVFSRNATTRALYEAWNRHELQY